jgi:hypothetical protein
MASFSCKQIAEDISKYLFADSEPEVNIKMENGLKIKKER